MVIIVMDSPSIAPARVNSSGYLADQPVPESPTSTDGWGEIENGIHEEQGSDKDGWDDIEPLEEPKPSPALASIQAAQKRPVSQPVSQKKAQGDIIIHITIVQLSCISVPPVLLMGRSASLFN
jgi:SCY1-like protein 1